MFDVEQPKPSAIAAFSLVLVAASFLIQARTGLTYSDEGFLWYGAVHTLSGEVPILDFQSYDPGRYYWSAFWMMFFGKSMLALRLSVAIFQVVGVFFGLLALCRVTRSWLILAPAGLLLILWMSPSYHKSFEISTSLITLFFAVFLIHRPSLRRHFIAGIITGLAAFMGRNLGAYSFVSFLFLILLIWIRLDRFDLGKKLASWSLGIVSGYSPMLLLFLAVPGFYNRTVHSIIDIFDRGSTNIAIAIPWPWLPDYEALSLYEGLHAFSLGALFLLLLAAYAAAFAATVCSTREALQKRSVLLAGFAVGALYIHYAFSRADLSHLAVAMPVLLVSLIALPRDLGGSLGRRGHPALLVAFSLLTIFAAGFESPLFSRVNTQPGGLIKYDIAGSDLWIPASAAQLIETIERINEEIVPKTEGFLIAPYWPALYVQLDRDSPLREIYFLHSLSSQREKEIIQKLRDKQVNWIFLGNVPLKAASRSYFRKNFPLIWEHFRADFVAVKITGLRRNFALLKRRDAVSRTIRSGE